MSESFPESASYKMETEVIAAGVDVMLAGQRSSLIEKWRKGKADAATTYSALEHLYWQNQDTADDATRHYLRETSYSFPVESGMDEDLVDAIYLAVQQEY